MNGLMSPFMMINMHSSRCVRCFCCFIINGEVLHSVENFNRTYRVDSDGETIIIGSRTDRLTFTMPNPPELEEIHQIQDGTHEDVAVDDGIVAVAWRDQGVKLYQADGTQINTILAEDAFAVDIFDKTSLILTNKS